MSRTARSLRPNSSEPDLRNYRIRLPIDQCPTHVQREGNIDIVFPAFGNPIALSIKLKRVQLKEFGRIIKSLLILRYIDDVELRQAVENS